MSCPLKNVNEVTKLTQTNPTKHSKLFWVKNQTALS